MSRGRPVEPRFAPYEELQVPLMVTRGAELCFVNAELFRWLRLDPAELEVPGPLDQLMRRVLPEFAEEAIRAIGARPPDNPHARTLWFGVRLGDGQTRNLAVRGSPGPGPGERTVALYDAEPEWAARRLSNALAAASSELMRCRTEAEVLETTVELISKQGFTTAVLRVSEAEFWHAALRQEPGSLAAGEKVYGRPVPEVRYPLTTLPGMTEMLRTGRAMFYLDAFERAEYLHPPELMAVIRKNNPPSCSLEAPIFAEERPYALLALQGQSLTPSAVGTFELFGQLVGRAIENVRHHLKLREQLEQVQRLQAEVVRQERLSALGEAAAMVSHEVRNPLGAIVNAVAVLKRGTSISSSARGELLQMIEEEALRLDALVHDLLELARPLEPRFTSVELGPLLGRIVDGIRAREAHHRLELDVPAELQLRADAALLTLAVHNLVRNALQATPRGGAVRVEVKPGDDRIALAVEDEGAGVAEADLARIFEPFYTTRATGTGLGLAVVKRVADAHGAEVKVGRGRLSGARFELRFPR